MTDLWKITEDAFDPQKQHHKETIFTIGNGYLCTRGAFEEGYPGDRRATFAHGVFDAVPISITELANAPDWLPFVVLLNKERFSLTTGVIRHFSRCLDLHTGSLTRTVDWVSPQGLSATISFERFTSLADEHIALIRCQVTPNFDGTVEFRASLNGNTDNEGVAHWRWITQGQRGETVYLHNRTRKSGIDYVNTMRLEGVAGSRVSMDYWDAENAPTLTMEMAAVSGQTLVVDKFVAAATSRDAPDPLKMALEHVSAIVDWPAACEANAAAWESEWDHTDVVIEGESAAPGSGPAEAQIALRFNLFQMLIAAPRHDSDVNIGAKTLSGFGYRGHSFWDTEIFMLQLFIYTAPQVAKNLLNYRYQRLPAARAKAIANGYEGAQFPWESADTGEEVTPTWVPHFADRNKLVRIWTGDIEIHISADVAFAAHKYWQVSGDDAWLVDQGAELILDTAKFWASRAEWNADTNRYEYNDVIGPDENHEHVDNNAYTNRMAQWNLQLALELLDWLRSHAPEKAAELVTRLDLTPERLAHWQEVIAKIYLNVDASGLIEQFEGFYQQPVVDLAAMEPRTRSVQEIYGIQEASSIQVLKQPDVLMMQYLLRNSYTDAQVRVNYDYYTPRTDHTYGSSLGPSIQAIMACEVGKPDDAYEHFIRAARADLRDVRGNAGDGIHAASAAGTWQAVVFGFAGLRVKSDGAGWTITPRLPKGWKRVAFKFFYRGELQTVDTEVLELATNE
jgi:kojibiose phosphorylase